MTRLVFLPGLGQDQHAYDLLGLEGWTPVYPGHGDRRPVPVRLEGIADEIAASLDEPVDIVGVALGGIVGQYLMIRHPELVHSAVLANTPSGVGSPVELLARADEALVLGVASMRESLVRRWFRPESIEADSPGVRYIRSVIDALPSEGFANMQRAMAKTDTAGPLRDVDAPVTLVQALDDPVGPGAVLRIHELLQHSRVVRIPGGHMVHLDNPIGLREVVLDHLQWVADGSILDRPLAPGNPE